MKITVESLSRTTLFTSFGCIRRSRASRSHGTSTFDCISVSRLVVSDSATPLDCSLSMEFSRQQYGSGLPFPSPCFTLRNGSSVSHSSCPTLPSQQQRKRSQSLHTPAATFPLYRHQRRVMGTIAILVLSNGVTFFIFSLETARWDDLACCPKARGDVVGCS